MRSEIHRRWRNGEYFFKCRRCKEIGLPHYSVTSAVTDRDHHKCRQRRNK